MYEPLAGTDRNLALEPLVATTWSSPDPLTWVFQLRQNVFFHSGQPLTPADVVYSIERLRDRKLGMSDYVSNIESVTPGAAEGMVVVKTHRPTSTLLNNLRFVLIVPRGATDLSTVANGTGPYRVQSFMPGSEAVLVRNEAYWGERAPVAEVRFRLSRPPGDALGDLVSGTSGFVSANTRAAEKAVSANPGFRIARQTSLFVRLLAMDVARVRTPFVPDRDNPFRDPRVREAVSLAIDRHALVAQLSGNAVPAPQLVPPFVFGFNPSLPPPRHDLARARALLAEAGLAAGFDVTLHCRRSLRDAGEAVVAMLARAGIRVTLLVLSDPDFYAQRQNASFQLSRFGCPTGDASLLFEQAVHTKDEVRRYGQLNDTGFSDPELDRAIEHAAEISDGETRRLALQELMARATALRSLVPLVMDEDVYAFTEDLAYVPRNDGYLFAQEIEIAR